MFVTTRHAKSFDPSLVVDPRSLWGRRVEPVQRIVRKAPDDELGTDQRGHIPSVCTAGCCGCGSLLVVQQRDAILDFAGKARVFSKLDIPRDPDIVFFGAEVGWEASIIRALFGDGGKLVLIDNDPAAYERFLAAPREVRIPAPRGFENGELVIRRDVDAIEYVREDFFEVHRPQGVRRGHRLGDRRALRRRTKARGHAELFRASSRTEASRSPAYLETARRCGCSTTRFGTS